MTATLAPPPPAAAPTPDEPARRPASAPRGLPLLAGAEVALAAVTVAAVLGLARLFEDGSFLLPVLTVAGAAHLLAGWCRRRGLPPATTALVAAGGLAAVLSWLLLPATTAYGIPTPATLAEAARQLSAAFATFRDVVAPAPVEPGFVLASSIGVWVIAFVADTAAFRAGAVVEAAVPGTTLFVFGAALGAPRQRGVITAVFLAGVLAYWLAQRALTNAASPTWLARDARAGSRALVRTGAGLGVAAIVAGLVLGPMLPGAESPSVVPWRASDRDGGSRVTISPLVDIRTRIVDQANAIVFTVSSPERSYWRLTALETFDGRIWSSTRSYKRASGELPAGTDDELVESTEVTQEFEIGALASIWLPAAYRPVRVDGASASWDAESGSLIVPEDVDVTQAGQRYAITSVLPRLNGEDLGQVPAVAPEDIAEAYTELPPGFSVAVREEAFRVTEGATTQYARALALQDHFRSGAFRYDLNVERGHGGDALERFLFETRAGYCEQFAGAYAAMARAIGLPARVAVGFTPGEPGADGRLVVRGANGHAWPEVYLEGYGWVPFEPTPGRGIPNATDYTGVPEQQADVGSPGTATTLPLQTAEDPLDPSAGAEGAVPPPDFGFEDVFPDIEPVTPVSPWPRRLAVAGAALVVVPALWAGAVALGRALHRAGRRRRARAAGAGARVALAWCEAGEALASVGRGPEPWETPAEVAARAEAVPGGDPQLLAELARTTTAAGFGPGRVDDEQAEAAEAAAARVRKDLAATWSWRQRLRAAFDPRGILPGRAARRWVTATSLGDGLTRLRRA